MSKSYSYRIYKENKKIYNDGFYFCNGQKVILPENYKTAMPQTVYELNESTEIQRKQQNKYLPDDINVVFSII